MVWRIGQIFEPKGLFNNRFYQTVYQVYGHVLNSSVRKHPVSSSNYVYFLLCISLCFKGNSAQVMNYNLPRECIRKYFPSRKCFTFPFPTNPDNVSYLETLDPSEISKHFLEVSDRFNRFIFDHSHVKNLKDGHKVTGRGKTSPEVLHNLDCQFYVRQCLPFAFLFILAT